MAQAEVQQWKLARQWMIERGVIPPIHPATKPSADLVDFARCLRDGVYLCMTLNKIKPNCVQFSPRPTMQVRPPTYSPLTPLCVHHKTIMCLARTLFETIFVSLGQLPPSHGTVNTTFKRGFGV